MAPRKAPPDADDTFAWEAPPEVNYVASKYDEPLAKIKAAPGRWARIKSGQAGTMYSAKNSVKNRMNNDRNWEIVVRRLDVDTYALYVRYRTEEQMRE